MSSHVLWFGLVWGSAVVAAVVATLAWRQRPRAGATSFAMTMLCGAWWAAGTGMELVATSQRWLVFWSQLQWLGIAFIPVTWLVFALEYTGRRQYVTPRILVFLSVLPTITLSLALSEGVHDILYAEMVVSVSGSLRLLSMTPGPWFWVYMAYTNVMLIAGSIYILQLAVGDRERYLGRVSVLLLIVLPPWVASVANAFGVTPVPNLDPTPITFVLTGVAGMVALQRYEFLHTTPVTDRIAQQSLVDTMDDGVLVVDGNDRIVDANPEARTILDADETVHGDDAEATLNEYDGIVAADRDRPRIERTTSNGERVYEIQVTPLDESNPGGGKILVFRDVTDQQARLQRLDVLNRVLRHNLRNEMNVVYGYADQIAAGDETIDTAAVADRIKEKSLEMVELGDRAREIDEILRAQDESEETVAVETVLAWERDRVRDEHPSVDIEYTVDGPAETLCRQALGTVLKILVENAVEHNDAASPAVRLTATVEGNRVVVAVSDNGPGIPESERAVLDAGEETDLKHGSGLGLWLANWGAQALSGDLSISDNYPGGSVVRISVPRLDREAGDNPDP